jgi:hypothetical protein
MGGGGGGSEVAPTPCTGAMPNPTGGCIIMPRPPAMGCCCGTGTTPRPAPRAIPGPPAGCFFKEDGGGPSTAKLMTFSPRIKTNPKVLFSTRSSINDDVPLFFVLRVRYSTASLRTKFKCLSKARKVPTIFRPSCKVTRNRCSTYRSSLLPRPLGCQNIQHEKGNC